jgi:hypothetical protein
MELAVEHIGRDGICDPLTSIGRQSPTSRPSAKSLALHEAFDAMQTA